MEKLLTKAMLTKYLTDGLLQEVNHGSIIFIERESVVVLIK